MAPSFSPNVIYAKKKEPLRGVKPPHTHREGHITICGYNNKYFQYYLCVDNLFQISDKIPDNQEIQIFERIGPANVYLISDFKN